VNRKERMCLVLKALAFFYCLVLLGVALTPLHAEELDVTYLAVSEHFSSEDYNQYNHQFFSFEVRNGNRGWVLATFNNSYYQDSVMFGRTRHWTIADHVEVGLVLGLVHGYYKYNRCPRLCPFVSPSITYTKYKYFRPRLSVAGSALVLSFSAKF